MEKTKQQRVPLCKECHTPMKGHLKNGHNKGRCRPNLWCDHGDNNKNHGGRYKWETQRWNGAEWKPVSPSVQSPKPAIVVAITKDTATVQAIDDSSQNKVIPLSQISQAQPPGACSEITKTDESDSDSYSDMPDLESIPDDDVPKEESADPELDPCVTALYGLLPEEEKEWYPSVSKSMWKYYQTWQTTPGVPFPTQMGMTSAQLGDIMQNYKKYSRFY